MNRDTLIRGVAALLVAGCGLYFLFGVAVHVAAAQKGTAIGHYEPVTFLMLWREATGISPGAVMAWLSIYDGCAVWFLGVSALWFLAALSAAFLLAVDPLLFLRSRKALGRACVIAGLGLPFGWMGLHSLKYTYLNAFVLRGLDGEWVIEFGPMLDAAGILYVLLCLLLLRLAILELTRRRGAHTLRRAKTSLRPFDQEV